MCIPKKVLVGELYAKYSLFVAHAGNSLCLTGEESLSCSSSRFQGSPSVGDVPEVEYIKIISLHICTYINFCMHIPSSSRVILLAGETPTDKK